MLCARGAPKEKTKEEPKSKLKGAGGRLWRFIST